MYNPATGPSFHPGDGNRHVFVSPTLGRGSERAVGVCRRPEGETRGEREWRLRPEDRHQRGIPRRRRRCPSKHRLRCPRAQAPAPRRDADLGPGPFNPPPHRLSCAGRIQRRQLINRRGQDITRASPHAHAHHYHYHHHPPTRLHTHHCLLIRFRIRPSPLAQTHRPYTQKTDAMSILQQDVHARAGCRASHRDVLRREPGQGGRRVSRVRLRAVEGRRRAAALARAREPGMRGPRVGPPRVRCPSHPPILRTGRPGRGRRSLSALLGAGHVWTSLTRHPTPRHLHHPRFFPSSSLLLIRPRNDVMADDTLPIPFFTPLSH